MVNLIVDDFGNTIIIGLYSGDIMQAIYDPFLDCYHFINPKHF